MASRDVVAADSFCATLFSFKPKSIGHIRKAAEKGLGSTEFRLITDSQIDLEDCRLRFNRLLFFILRTFMARMRK